MCSISYKYDGVSVLEQSLKNIQSDDRASSVELSLAAKFFNVQKFTCAIYLHEPCKFCNRLQQCLFSMFKNFHRSGFQFCVRSCPPEIRRVKLKKLLNVILLVISIFIFKWFREIPFKSYHGSTFLTNLSQLSSQILPVKFPRKGLLICLKTYRRKISLS